MGLVVSENAAEDGNVLAARIHPEDFDAVDVAMHRAQLKERLDAAVNVLGLEAACADYLAARKRAKTAARRLDMGQS